jgi:hypothetical protein
VRRKRLAIDEFHREKIDRALCAIERMNLVYPADVGVRYAQGSGGFGREHPGVSCPGNLDGARLAELFIGGEEHRAHAAGGNRADDPEAVQQKRTGGKLDVCGRLGVHG